MGETEEDEKDMRKLLELSLSKNTIAEVWAVVCEERFLTASTGLAQEEFRSQEPVEMGPSGLRFCFQSHEDL